MKKHPSSSTLLKSATTFNFINSFKRDPQVANMSNNNQTRQLLKRSHLTNNHLQFIVLLALLSIIQLLPFAVHCQGFEDLNSNSNKHNFQPHSTRIQAAAAKHTFQRPNLSSRFAPNPQSGSSSQPQLAILASSSATVFSDPPQQQQQQQQQAASSSSGFLQQSSSQPISSIEQMMKNALARTAQLNSAAEPRIDIASPASASSELVPTVRASAQQQPSIQPEVAASNSNKVAELTEIGNDNTRSSPVESDDKQTTQTTTPSNHETVYSEQRFANLFARRGANKKSRIQPFEQVKAKPTLPSFIKSPPDPKQFSSVQAATQDRPSTPSGSLNSFASQRLQQQQQQNQGRINLANQQKKAAITSNSAAAANNKRATALASKAPNATVSNPKSAASTSKAVATGATSSNKPASAPFSNNPFNRSQNSNSDPASVIAMARKRLLANNALESNKLKQQQNKQIN